MTRHMRNAVITGDPTWTGGAPDGTEAERLGTDSVYAPVAVAFTEDEVKALAKFLRMIDAVAQLDAFTDTSEEAANIVSATNAITAAADDIEGDKQ